MKELFVCGQEYMQNYIPQKGVPRSTETIVRDSPTTSPGDWTLYISGYHNYPPPEEFKLPAELYYEIPGYNKITFDFLGWNRKVFIVSESMLAFFKEYGITENYETSIIKEVLSRSGKKIETEHQYYALRFCLFDDGLMDFHIETKIRARGTQGCCFYPNMSVKAGVTKEIFVLKEFVYADSLIFTEAIKMEIEKRKFICPNIYSMNLFHITHNGQ